MAAAKTSPHMSKVKLEAVRGSDAGLAASKAIEKARPEERGPMLNGMIETAVRRLSGIIDEETEALRKGASSADFKTFNSRKSLSLVELNRAIRLLGDTPPDPSTLRLLASLNRKLEVNQQVLKLHMDAVGEIAGIISQTIREADSDGTYTHAFRSKGKKP